jgi:hypothetical protein
MRRRAAQSSLVAGSAKTVSVKLSSRAICCMVPRQTPTRRGTPPANFRTMAPP